MSSDWETFGFFGTPLPELEETATTAKSKTLRPEEQIVTDEKGRRRFHGAFTGGFSAGYFNTVGSEEGWTPSTFLSTRGYKTEKQSQKPEDYMDAEDLGEFGIAPREIKASKNFAAKRSPVPDADGMKTATGHRLAWERDEVASDNVDRLGDLIKPASDSIGVRLLEQMGWRQGQGVGPKRMINKDKPATEPSTAEKKVYGCSLPPAQVAPTLEALEPTIFSVGPEDVDAPVFVAKVGTHGLGYHGLSTSAVLDERVGKISSALRQGDKAKSAKGIRGQAFGVGAFEDEDEEVYFHDDMTQYDFTIGKGMKQNENYSKEFDEFTMASKPLAAKKFYAAPKLPQGWEPAKRTLKPKQQTQSSKAPLPVHNAAKNVGPVERAGMLGEAQSVFAFLSTADRERLQAIKEAKVPPKFEPDRRYREKLAFPKDAVKQRRFEDYAAYLRKGLLMPPPRELTEWEWTSEKDEFLVHLPPDLQEVAHRLAAPLAAARPDLLKPLAEKFRNKFTSGGTEEYSLVNKEVDTRPRENADKLKAVQMKMFGPMTRERHEWHPDRILCKRFNVPDPYPNSKVPGVPGFHKNASHDEKLGLGTLMTTADEMAEREREAEIKKELEEQAQTVNDSLATETRPDDDVSAIAESRAVTTASEAERPSMDLFKAIFANSSSEESASDDEEPTASTSEPSVLAGTHEPTKLAETSRVRSTAIVHTESKTVSATVTASTAAVVDREDVEVVRIIKREVDTEDVDVVRIIKRETVVESFGPALPPGVSDGARINVQRSISPKRAKNSHQRKKHKKKHSKREHKDKRKEKRRRRHSSSSSDSESSKSSWESR